MPFHHSMPSAFRPAGPALPFLGALVLAYSAGAEPAVSPVDFEQVRPLLKEFCLECHSTEKQKGDLDLEVFTSLEQVKRRPKIWQNVAEQLEAHEMPPKKKRQPAPEQYARLIGWTRTMLASVAQEHAGDPGPVVLRRLSNAEYTYTVRDLTGVPSLDPAREFPVDGAAGEGFTNTGQALAMSPALLTKYLDAGKAIASHAVLLPDGVRFSAGTTRRDWTEEIMGDIHAFYRRFTSADGGEQVNLQGVKFQTNSGGRIPVESYLASLLKSRDALGASESTPATALNARYLGLLWQTLNGGAPSWLMDDLRARWKTARPGDEHELAAYIVGWQKALWKLNTVGYIGVPGKAKAWMEPASPLVSRQEFKIKIPAAKRGEVVKLYLVSAAVGENLLPGVVWEKPRVVVKGKPDLLIGERDLDDYSPPPLLTMETLPGSTLLTAASSIVGVRLPADAAAGSEFVVTARLPADAKNCSAQVDVLSEKPPTAAAGARKLPAPGPILMAEGAAARRTYEEGFAAFRDIFPAALCYDKIVPSDEVVTLLQFYREDRELQRLMLSEEEKKELDRLWNELRFVSRDALTQVDALLQIIEYATQDSDPKPFRAARPAFEESAAKYRQQLLDAEPRQLASVLNFAARAYRRSLSDTEKAELQSLYQKLRSEELPHEEALRLLLAKIFMAPAFLYRTEAPAPGLVQAPVKDVELATRLSYFLWSSAPDAELSRLAAAGQLRDPAVLRAQTKRMLAAPAIRRLAMEFGCQWLHLRDFDGFEEKSDIAFPTFAALRGPMLEEAVQTFTDLFQNDGKVLSLLEADYTYLNEPLAQHYGVPDVAGPEWRRVWDVRKLGRGGVLGLGAVLAKQAGASRSSPILRGDFVVETLLGEKIPRPPKDVPPFPEEKVGPKLTVRQITEKHSLDERCAHCHARMDPYGFALESFDGIGRFRERDEGGQPIKTKAKLLDGTELAGADALRAYLSNQRRDDFLRQFCRKLLGFALARGVQLSDEPLLTEMRTQLAANEFRVSTAINCIVQSRQFRDIRGSEMKDED